MSFDKETFAITLEKEEKPRKGRKVIVPPPYHS